MTKSLTKAKTMTKTLTKAKTMTKSLTKAKTMTKSFLCKVFKYFKNILLFAFKKRQFLN